MRNQRLPVDEPWRAIGIPQIQCHGDDGGVEGRSSALVRRIAHHTVFPDVMRRAVKIYARFFKMIREVHQRVDAERESMGRRDIPFPVQSAGIVDVQRMVHSSQIVGRELITFRC